uniref:hypothetical protein n=1 Tax=Roseivirga sp. TaxID=1964215 RepID=UPI00404751D6
MKEFDLSDKEIKALLQEEGLEEPSMAFNNAIMAEIKAFESKAKPVTAPKWLIISLLLILIIPSIIGLTRIQLPQTEFLSKLDFSKFHLDLEVSSSYLWICISVVFMVWMAVLFDKFVIHGSKSQG